MRTAQKPKPINRSGDYSNMLRRRESEAYRPFVTEENSDQVRSE